jgi:hypothetical protein
MKSWGLYELMRQQAQELKQQGEPEPRKIHWAPGSLEYQAEQEEKTLRTSEQIPEYVSRSRRPKRPL